MFSEVTLSGVGVHTGSPCRVAISPAPPGTGVAFETESGTVLASPHTLAADSRRATDLVDGEARARTVEHLMAALSWLGETDVRVRLHGPEIPALDGSSAPWLEALIEAGAAPGPRWVIPSSVASVELDGGERASMSPLDDGEEPSIRVRLDFGPGPIGRQECRFGLDSGDFSEEVAPARSFASEREVDGLRRAGLGLGGSLDNALVLGEDGPLNPGGYRLPEEPARHKILDAMGDLFLLGGLPRARIDLFKPGHRLVHALVRRAETGPDVRNR